MIKEPTSKSLLFAILIGSIPALIAYFSDEKAFQKYDFLIASTVLVAALLYSRRDRTLRFRFPAPLAVLIVSIPVFLHSFAPGPITNDEQAYLHQSKLFSTGQLAEPLSDSDIAIVFQRRQLYEDESRGLRFSKYPPGTSLAMIPAVWLDWPLLSTLICALIDLWLLFLIAKEIGLKEKSHMAIGLLATSPFFLLLNTSWQSEVFSLPLILFSYYSYLRLPSNFRLWGLALGSALGMAFLCRPLTAVVVALIFGSVLLRQRKLSAVCFSILGGVPFLTFSLAFNSWATGEPFTTTYEIYSQKYTPFDVYGRGDFWTGFLRQWGRWSIAFGGMLGAIGLALWGSWLIRKRDGGIIFLLLVLLPIAYSFHWYLGHRLYLGPLYLVELLPLLIIALLYLLARCPDNWRQGIPLAMMAFGGCFFTYRYGLILEESKIRAEPQLVASSANLPSGAIVFLPSKKLGNKDHAFKHWTPSLPSDLVKNEPVFLRTTRNLTPQVLVKKLNLQGRPLYFYDDRDYSIIEIE